MKAFQKIDGFIAILKGRLALFCHFVSGLLTYFSALIFNIRMSIGRPSLPAFWGNCMKRVFIPFVFLVFYGMSVSAQQNFFRVVGGIPHLPVFDDVANADAVIGTTEPGMLIFSRADAAPFLNVGGAWINICQEKSWTGGVDFFQVKGGIPFIPLKASAAGIISPGAVFFSSAENSVMVASGARTFMKLPLLKGNAASFTETPGFEALGGTEKLFRLPILTTLPSTGVEQGAICIETASKAIYFYDGGWTQLSCGFVCGASILVDHRTSNLVAPENKILSYGTVTEIPGEPTKCWTTKNLGADQQATAVDDATEPSAGWYWQFNRKQGYKHDGSTRTPATTWIDPIIENRNWQDINDPCVLELKDGWRLPTYTEWYNVMNAAPWNTMADAWNSDLKLHAAGYLLETDGTLQERSREGLFASSSLYSDEWGYALWLVSTNAGMAVRTKSYGRSVRCIRDINYSALAPSQPGPIFDGPEVICTAACYTYKILPVAGATSYDWSFSGLASTEVSPDGLNFTICPTSLGYFYGGIISVVARNKNGTSNPTTFYVDISIYTVNCGTYICRTGEPGQVKNVYLSQNGQGIGVPYGGSFTAKNTSGTPTNNLVIDPETGQIDVYASQPGGYFVCFQSENGCQTCCSVAICDTPVSPAIAYPVTQICKYPNTYLSPSVMTPSNENPNPLSGGTYMGGFTSDEGLVINYQTGVISVGASAVGTHIVTYTPNPLCCPDVKVTTTIRIDALPTVEAAIVRGTTCDNPTADVELSFDLHPPYPAPTAPSPQYFYPPDHGYYLRIYNLSVTSLCGSVQWWDAPYGGNQLDTWTDLVNGRTYYASQCYSDERVAITVYLVDYSVPAPPVYPPTNLTSWTIYNAMGSVVASGGGTVTGTGTYTVQGLEPGTYTCIATNEDTGCTSQAITITILPPSEDCLLYTIIPDCTTGKSDVEICLTDLVSDLNDLSNWRLNVEKLPSGYSASFNFTSSPCITIHGLDTGTYRFTANNATITAKLTIEIGQVCCPPTIKVYPITCYTMEGGVDICVNGYETSGTCDWTLTLTDPDGAKVENKNITDKCFSISGLGPGTYTVTVANHTTNCPPETTTFTLYCPDTCKPGPIVYTIDREPDCENKTADITITGLPSGSWTLDPGNLSGSGTSKQIKDLAPGTYYYVVTDTNGCFSDTLTVTIVCPEECTAEAPSFTVMRAPDCENKTADIAFALPGGTWTVNPGNNTTSNVLYPVYGLAPGTYHYTFTNDEGCVSDTVTVKIECPKDCFNAMSASIERAPTCDNKTADIKISGFPTGNWVVYPGGFTGTGTSDVIYNVPVGHYRFTVTDQFGCTSDQVIDLKIECPPDCQSECLIPEFNTTVPDCVHKTFDLTINNLPAGEWWIEPGGHRGNGGSLFIPGLEAGVQYVYTFTDQDGHTATYVVFVPPPCCPVTVTVQCIQKGHNELYTWDDHSKITITGLPLGGCTLTRLSPTPAAPEAVADTLTSKTFYGLPNGTYTYRVRNQWGCEFEITFTVKCEFASVKMVREPVCGVDPTADLEFSGLPADGWKIIPIVGGGSPVLGEGTTKVLYNIAQGDHTYEIYNIHEELISTLSITVPYPGNKTIPSVTLLNEDCTVKKTGSIYLDHLPSTWTIFIGTLIEQTGEGASYQFDNVAMGTYSVSVLDRSTGCISDSVSVTICK